MQNKIALEEHFAIEATLGDSHVFGAHVWDILRPRLLDIQDLRLKEMDKHGIEMMILSLNAPAIQAIQDVKRAIAVAREANDVLADEAHKRPDRFAAFAALPMQDPDAAAQELTRCVKELGFVGALVNGFSQSGDPENVLYYDLPQYRPFWHTVATLDVPFYLHPRNPLASWTKFYDGHAWMWGPNWAFAAETAVHALRLIGSGLFDEYPGLNIVLGHLGEGIPAQLWRIDHRNSWMKAPHHYAAKKSVADYFRKHFHLTTSGNFHTPSLVNCMTELGAERVMFSVDWPFEAVDEAVSWFDKAEIDEAERRKIGRDNAENLITLNVKEPDAIPSGAICAGSRQPADEIPKFLNRYPAPPILPAVARQEPCRPGCQLGPHVKVASTRTLQSHVTSSVPLQPVPSRLRRDRASA
jgi:2,3-dihydroxybenzoate decarboxylase